MTEILKQKRNLSLITLEGLRDFVKQEVEFEYRFDHIGYGAKKMPNYHMYVYRENEEHILVVAKVGSKGPTVRKLNLFPAVVSIHREFGNDSSLDVFVTSESTDDDQARRTRTYRSR